MKTIIIPKRFGYPTMDIAINGIEHTFNTGVEVEMEDEVAEVIENALALAPKHEKYFSRFAQFVAGKITEVTEEELDGIPAISRCAFYNCDSLISVVVPDSVTTIGNEAFSDCSNLKSVAFGENSQLTSIDGYAFYKCSLLTTIMIPENVMSIGSAAFSNCTGLKNVTMRAMTPPTIKADTFANIPTTCIFEVPSDSLNAYKSAQYWSAIANQIVAIEE